MENNKINNSKSRVKSRSPSINQTNNNKDTNQSKMRIKTSSENRTKIFNRSKTSFSSPSASALLSDTEDTESQDTGKYDFQRSASTSCSNNNSTFTEVSPRKKLLLPSVSPISNSKAFFGNNSNQGANRNFQPPPSQPGIENTNYLEHFTDVGSKLDRLTRTVTNLVDAVEDRFISVDRRLDEISNKVDCVQASVAKQKEMIPETVPKELRKKVRTMYGQLPEDEKWLLDNIFTSSINSDITDQFVNDVKERSKKYSEGQIREACRGYFYHLTREYKLANDNPDKLESQHQEKKQRSRRQRLLESRQKFLKKEEQKLWEGVTQELMSDEEDIEDGAKFKIKSPPWRNLELSQLIVELERRKEEEASKEGRQVLRKGRVLSDSPMKRQPTKKVKTCFLES